MVKELNYGELYNSRAKEFNINSDENNHKEVIQDLKDTLKKHPERVYLCANEIGYELRIACIRFEDKFMLFLNPVFQERKGYKLIREMDYATGKEFITPRNNNVTICYQTSKGDIIANKLNEEGSIVFCQVMDCLDGIHATDYGLEVLPEFDTATPEEQEEVISAYISSITNVIEQFDEELTNDEEFKHEWVDYKYMKAKATGEIEVEEVDNNKLNRTQRRKLDRIIRKLERRGNKNGKSKSN